MKDDLGYKATIGLEVHAELNTKSKMFCGCKNDPEERRPNVNICPICMAHPGTLPVINKQAFKNIVKVGLAVGGKIADFTEFDRKNYFYPDIPKGYQISQYIYPIVSGGSLNGVALTRVHLEEDTARSTHDKGDYSLIDYNRAGVPLMELVTEPVVKSAQEASAFAKELQLLLKTLGVSEANMEKGEMRVEANISVSKTDKFGTKVEVKNLNSFKVVEKAIEYEIKRHIKAIESGEKIIQETRGWNENTMETFSQREKESSHDYRYFPDPDLPKIKISELKDFTEIVLPELPWQKRERLKNNFGLTELATEIFVSDIILGNFFDEVVKNLDNDKKNISLAVNYITSDLTAILKDKEMKIPKASDFAELIKMIGKNVVSSRGAKEVLVTLCSLGGNPLDIAEKMNLIQKSDAGELKDIVVKIIEENKKVVDEYKAGKTASLQFLIGQGMKESKGSANPQILKDIFINLLG